MIPGAVTKTPPPPGPAILGLFEKKIPGDDALMELARLRFKQAGLGAEMYAATPEQLEWSLGFRPSPAAPVTVHLSRDFNLADEQSRSRIEEFASRFAGQVRGWVVHDHPDLAAHPQDYLRAARDLDARLRPIEPGSLVFLEYAAGLDPALYARFIGSIRDLERVSACIDIGHVGIQQARATYAALHPGVDVCTLKDRPADLPPLLPDIEQAATAALPAVLELIETLAALGKPLHFHLHDGHPLSTFSPYGVSDHLSFFMEIPLDFTWQGRQAVPLLYGLAGAARIVTAALSRLRPELVSFTLEIHPAAGRLPLEDAAPLFQHWPDKTNPEEMNYWLSILSRNHAWLIEVLNLHAT